MFFTSPQTGFPPSRMSHSQCHPTPRNRPNTPTRITDFRWRVARKVTSWSLRPSIITRRDMCTSPRPANSCIRGSKISVGLATLMTWCTSMFLRRISASTLRQLEAQITGSFIIAYNRKGCVVSISASIRVWVAQLGSSSFNSANTFLLRKSHAKNKGKILVSMRSLLFLLLKCVFSHRIYLAYI